MGQGPDQFIGVRARLVASQQRPARLGSVGSPWSPLRGTLSVANAAHGSLLGPLLRVERLADAKRCAALDPDPGGPRARCEAPRGRVLHGVGRSPQARRDGGDAAIRELERHFRGRRAVLAEVRGEGAAVAQNEKSDTPNAVTKMTKIGSLWVDAPIQRRSAQSDDPVRGPPSRRAKNRPPQVL
jgi:hypothetical protein